ncbi:hypothetical protein MLD38_022075 [Melastoma candidum]|uniref:Uncharacterized protein n=1 Tax=Melastoma candidum TaxID=119954 RepID=A0ACB9QHZ9_9MYRT|nr:hypothetical protein MLD38_022075 [Melastoma candidum]
MTPHKGRNSDDKSTVTSGSAGAAGTGDGSNNNNNSGSGVALKKGPWTAAEDAVLMEYVKINGEGNWNAVQKNTGLARCGKSCRLRWTNHLRPNLKKGSFTPEEERQIIELHSQLGNKWARMAAQLPGRTDNEIKNYWNTRIKRRIRQGLPLYPHDIVQQPQPSPTSSAPNSQATMRGLEPNPSNPIRLQSRPPPIQVLSPSMRSAQLLANGPTSLSFSPQFGQHYNSSFYNPSTSMTSPMSNPSTSMTSPMSNPLQMTPPPVQASSPSSGFKRSFHDISLNTGFSLSFPMSQGFHLPSPHATQSQSPGSFQYSPLTYNLNSPQSMQTTDRLLSPASSVYPTKAELPSSQFCAPQIGTSEMQSMPDGSCGLLEDLLEEAHAMASCKSTKRQNLMNVQDEKLGVSLRPSCDWDTTGAIPSAVRQDMSEGFVPAGQLINDDSSNPFFPMVQDGMKYDSETTEQMHSIQDHLSRLLDVVPSSMQVSSSEYNSGQESMNGNGQSSSYTYPAANNTAGEAIMQHQQHMGSLFPMDNGTTGHSRNHSSNSWDMSGFC